MKNIKKESGFAHIMILTVILAVALVGTLGFVYWQNFMQTKNTPVVNTDTSTAKATQTPEKDSLVNIAYDQSAGSGLAIKYPNGWNLKHTDLVPGDDHANVVQMPDSNNLTSPSGNITLKLWSGISGIGGICDSSDTNYKIYSYSIVPMPNYSGYSLVEFAAHSSDTDPVYDNYAVKVVQNRSEFSKASVGGSPCFIDSTAFPAKKNGATSWFKLEFKDVKNITSGVMDQIQKDLNSAEYTTARKIMLSLYQKD